MARRRNATHCGNGHPIQGPGRCVECRRASEARYRRTEGGRANRRQRVRRSLGVLDPPKETREGSCEACGLPAAPLHLDHNHTTGAIRGWLCMQCNQGLGKLKDSPMNLRAALAYLEKYGAGRA